MKDIYISILFSGLSGAFGGIIASINTLNVNEIHIGAKHVKLGFWGDLIIGYAAGIAVLILEDRGKNVEISTHLVAMGLLAGVAGNKLLMKMSDAMLGNLIQEQKKLENKIEKLDVVSELVKEGELLLNSNDPLAAEGFFRKALEIIPNHHLALLDLAKAYRHQADPLLPGEQKNDLMKKAIDSLSKAIKTSPKYEKAFYNRACYIAVSGGAIKDIISDLNNAIDLFEGNRQLAAKDIDFDSIKNDNEFIKIINK